MADQVIEVEVKVVSDSVDTAINKVDKLNDTVEKTEEGIDSVGSSVKSNTGLINKMGTVGTSAIGGLGKGFTKFGGVLKGVGNALKANPIMLIAVIIIEIVEAVKKVLEFFGVWQVVLDAIGAVFDWLIEQVKKFLRWLGILGDEEEDNDEAAKQRAADRKAIEEIKYNSIISGMEREIRVMKAQGASAEEIAAKEEVMLKTKIKHSEKALEEFQVYYDTMMYYYKMMGLSSAKLEEEYAKLKEQVEEDKTKLKEWEGNQTKLAVEGAKEREAARKAEADRRLRITREIQDAEINAMTDVTARTIEQSNIKYQRLVEDKEREYQELIKAAGKDIERVKMLEAERTSIITGYKNEQVIKAAEIQAAADAKAQAEKDKQIAADKKREEDYSKWLEGIYKLRTLTMEQAAQKALDDLSKARTDADNKVDENLQAGLDSLEKKYEADVLAAGNNEVKKQEIFEQYLKDEQALRDAASQEKININQIYEGKIIEQQKKNIDEAAAYEIQKEKDKYNAKLDTAQKWADGISALNQAISDIANLFGKKDEKASKERAKRQFNREKILNAVMAAIAGGRAIVEHLGDPFPLNLIQQALIGITTASQIAAIMAQKFDPESASGGSGSAATASATATTTTEPTLPNVQGYNTGMGGTATEVKPVTAQQPVIRAYVTESDISTTQGRLADIRNLAEL